MVVETNKETVIRKKNLPSIYRSSIRSDRKYSRYAKSFDIKTGAIIKCRTIRNIPMPQAIIKSVYDWSKRSSRSEHQNEMVFSDRLG